MATFEIPITANDPSFKIRTILEGVQLVFRFDWNGRDIRWNISIYDTSENPLVLGLPLNINTELLERFEIAGLPPGLLMLYDTSGKNVEAGRDDLGDRCKLVYLTSDDESLTALED